MPKFDPAVTALTVAGLLAIAGSVLINLPPPKDAKDNATITTGSTSSGEAKAATDSAARPQWAASATGRIEPKDGEIRLDSQLPGRIVEVLAKVNDKVKAGDLLARVDDEEWFSKYTAAEAEVLVREREREEEPAAKGPQLDLRRAEDNYAAAERARFKARMAFDETYRSMKNGKSSAENVEAARTALADANTKLESERVALEKASSKNDTPLPTRLESAVTIARADVTQIEQAIEKSRLRAPADGTVLNVWAKVGEFAEQSPETALVLFGDISGLRVRAEVEERDVVKIRVGQRIVVKADAFPDREFEGVVTSLAPALGPPHILSRGPRRPNDVEVLEVVADLDGLPPLLTGMRVDTFFRMETTVSAAPEASK